MQESMFFQTQYFFCDQIDAKFEMGFKQSQLPEGLLQYIKVHIKTSSRIILDESLDFEGLYRMFERLMHS
jgi:hypothetical protein